MKMKLRTKDLGSILGAAFFVCLATLSAMEFVTTSNLMALGVMLYNALLVWLLITRRAPFQPSSPRSLALGILGSLVPFAALASYSPGGKPIEQVAAGIAIQAAALLWMTWSASVLGRSFGVAPADRQLVTHGPYRWVRHPLYLGELVFYAGLFIAQPSAPHGALWIVLCIVQVMRLRIEETVLEGYAEYAQTVKWKMVPGVY